MEDSSQGWTQLGSFFQNRDTFFDFQKRAEEKSVFLQNASKRPFSITDILDNKINGNRY